MSPLQHDAVARAPWGRAPARRRAAPGCRDGAGCVDGRGSGRVSMTRPRYITTTSSQRYSTTERSCAMNSMVRPKALLQVLDQIEHLRLHRHVERRDRLVGDDEVRLDGERAGDADALALAAGELVREAPRRARGRGRRARAARRSGRVAPRRGPRRCDVEGLADDLVDAQARVEAGIRILEDDLHAPAIGAHGAVRQACAGRRRRTRSRPPVGSMSRRTQRPAVRLARAGFADEAHDGAAPDVEADAVDGAARRRRGSGNAWSGPRRCRSGVGAAHSSACLQQRLRCGRPCAARAAACPGSAAIR